MQAEAQSRELQLSSSMAKWSQLPEDLLLLIAQRLNTHSGLLSLRSVCSSWRASLPSKLQPFPSRFSILPPDGTSSGLYLSRRTILSFGLPQPDFQPTVTSWLIKIEEDVPGMMHLVDPLTTSQKSFQHLPRKLPITFDISRFRISELGQEYVLQRMNGENDDEGSLHAGKVIFSRDGQDFVMLTVDITGELAMFRRGNKRLTIIDDTESPPPRWDDLILFDGKFYAVDANGRTVVVVIAAESESPPALSLIADPVFGGDEKRLVDCDGELLMVDTYFGDHIHGIMRRAIGFKVFKLDRMEKNKWTEIETLGDRMVFLGERSTFSAPASEFSGCEGNCIYYANSFFFSSEEEDGADTRMVVFNLEKGKMGALSNFPEYSQVIWPPPAWICS